MIEKEPGASDIRNALYGRMNDPKEPITERPLGGKVQLGIDLTLEPQGNKLLRLKKGNLTVVIPQARYTEELEKRVEELERKVAKLEASNNRMTIAHNGLVRALAEVKQELKKKVSRNGI